MSSVIVRQKYVELSMFWSPDHKQWSFYNRNNKVKWSNLCHQNYPPSRSSIKICNRMHSVIDENKPVTLTWNFLWCSSQINEHNACRSTVIRSNVLYYPSVGWVVCHNRDLVLYKNYDRHDSNINRILLSTTGLFDSIIGSVLKVTIEKKFKTCEVIWTWSSHEDVNTWSHAFNPIFYSHEFKEINPDLFLLVTTVDIFNFWGMIKPTSVIIKLIQRNSIIL